MTVKARNYHGEEDYQKVRKLLIESYRINQRLHNWGLDRWDVSRYAGNAEQELSGERLWEKDVRVWEDTESGKIVGAVHPEGSQRTDIFFQIHPDYRHLEEEMLMWAIEHHQASRPENVKNWPLKMFLAEYDTHRAALLEKHGFENQGHCGYTRRCSLEKPIPEPRFPDGYSIRPLKSKSEFAAMAELSNAVFGSHWTAETVRVRAAAPTYRPQFDLVVIAPDGDFAAYCILWPDEENSYAVFEPVGTHPDYRQRGLAKQMLLHGLHLLKTAGIKRAYVGAGTDPIANRLYQSTGFVDADQDFFWKKDFA